MSIRSEFGLLENPPVVNNLAPINFTEDSLLNTKASLDSLGMDAKGFYAINSHHLRCEELSKEHDGLHVVFAGCSVTTGEGIPIDMTWSKIVYDRLSKQQKLSGYYNIAQPGSTPIDIIHQVITYIGEFARPDIIFINLPDLDREDRYVRQGHENTDNPHVAEDIRIATGIQIYGHYSMLLDMCRRMNIKLISFTWDDVTKPTDVLDVRKQFSNFFTYTKEQMSEHLFNFEMDNRSHKLKKYFLTALDGSHPGVAFHDFYADFAYNILRRIS